MSFIPKAFATHLVPSGTLTSEAALRLAGRGSAGDSLAPGTLLPAMAKWGLVQQHSGSDVPESS